MPVKFILRKTLTFLLTTLALQKADAQLKKVSGTWAKWGWLWEPSIILNDLNPDLRVDKPKMAGALVTAAVVDRTVDPPAGHSGDEATSGGGARTEAWAAVADLDARLAPDSANPCERGDAECLDAVVAEMQARLEAQGCAHTAPFASTYLEMTRGVRDAVRSPAYFDDPAAAAHADALFARLYFDAFDHWAAGREDEVPGAWRLAFGAAERDTPNAATDLLLGMNAHISRDLAYALLVDLIEKNEWRDSLNRWWWLEVKRAKFGFCVGSC